MNAANLIEREKDTIIKQWLERVETKIPQSQHYDQPVIMNSVPDLLDALIKALRSQDVSQIASKGEAHGKQRAPFPEYSLRHVIKEYRLLKRTIFNTLDQYPKSKGILDRDIIMHVIDEAVEQASEAFYQVRKEVDASEKEKIEQLLMQNQEQDTMRDQFIASLTHDIRSPLNNTLSAVELLESILPDAHDELIDRLINVIKLSMSKGNDLINNLLNVSLIQAGKHLPIYKQESDLLKAIQDSIHSFSPDVQARIHVQSNQAQIIGYWDVKVLSRAIDNLISNALHYGDKDGDITLKIKQDEHQTIMEVHNHGEAIPEDKQQEIFQLYYRDSPKKSRGWGLGLTLVKGIIEAHKGEVTLRSTKEEGTTFILTIPNNTDESR